MHFGAGFTAADPEMTTGFALRGRDAAIERSGNFHGDVGEEGGDEFCVAIVKPAGLFLQHTRADLHPRRTQAGDAHAVHLRVGVGGVTTTRETPAAISASAQGPVRPWWLQGSRVT